MPIWREDKELSKYSKYKAKMDLTKIGTSSERARVACLLAGVLLRGAALARVCLCWLCVRFRTAQVASCHSRDRSLNSSAIMRVFSSLVHGINTASLENRSMTTRILL